MGNEQWAIYNRQDSKTLFHVQTHTFRVAAVFGSIHALNGCNTVAECTGVRNKKCIFENKSSFWQVLEEKVCAGIRCTFIIAQPSLPFVIA